MKLISCCAEDLMCNQLCSCFSLNQDLDFPSTHSWTTGTQLHVCGHIQLTSHKFIVRWFKIIQSEYIYCLFMSSSSSVCHLLCLCLCLNHFRVRFRALYSWKQQGTGRYSVRIPNANDAIRHLEGCRFWWDDVQYSHDESNHVSEFQKVFCIF